MSDETIPRRFRVDEVHHCTDCDQDTPHVEVGNTAICLRCGYGRWIA